GESGSGNCAVPTVGRLREPKHAACRDLIAYNLSHLRQRRLSVPPQRGPGMEQLTEGTEKRLHFAEALADRPMMTEFARHKELTLAESSPKRFYVTPGSGTVVAVVLRGSR